MERMKERNLQVLKIVATAFILAVICTCSAVSAANLNVDSETEGGYTTIQAAVDAAKAGDTIFVSPGTYVENLKIDRQVRIWSDSRNPNNTIVKAADPAESTVEITAERVTFSGFGVEDSKKAGILLTGANNCYINNNRARNSEYGILLQEAGNNNINGNTITLNEIGIRLEGSDSNTIQDNLVAYNYGFGISLEESRRNIIFNNYFKNAENVEENTVNADNTWQSTLSTKSNLVRGPYIGGNFWADLEGTGYSETCVDGNSNGICDVSYEVTGGGSDNSPLFPKVPNAVTSLESKLDAEAYEQGLADREGAGNETGTPVEEQTEENETAGEGNETNETEAPEENGAPGPGLGFTVLAAGAAYILKRRR
ncbi:nitrous oxide reductase family maturation protein NosD [Methanosarcina sp. 1.H.A.2.2]|uniref:right-handed parallel beta-helix repeat-containing protein n=1 Tax=Methanosarcina sp. 1.H.A.2.2 TaxID=1483601 RepID=UPI000621DD01|nr:NosD domain-containing protein [Methanosarcina sp. 1.H.A.2.2]KKH48570.1 cell surface protein [Methanosarcina sp. 1.H.A.2.2]